ncbi:hypothetical protein BC832DRAFT_459372 [Gaertneriomyces semiglobifer]|nr:hypothetical protein BC832DRAFT_459372 [Gaertneriomyces semiglobifer]
MVPPIAYLIAAILLVLGTAVAWIGRQKIFQHARPLDEQEYTDDMETVMSTAVSVMPSSNNTTTTPTTANTTSTTTIPSPNPRPASSRRKGRKDRATTPPRHSHAMTTSVHTPLLAEPMATTTNVETHTADAHSNVRKTITPESTISAESITSADQKPVQKSAAKIDEKSFGRLNVVTRIKPASAPRNEPSPVSPNGKWIEIPRRSSPKPTPKQVPDHENEKPPRHYSPAKEHHQPPTQRYHSNKPLQHVSSARRQAAKISHSRTFSSPPQMPRQRHVPVVVPHRPYSPSPSRSPPQTPPPSYESVINETSVRTPPGLSPSASPHAIKPAFVTPSPPLGLAAAAAISEPVQQWSPFSGLDINLYSTSPPTPIGNHVHSHRRTSSTVSARSYLQQRTQQSRTDDDHGDGEAFSLFDRRFSSVIGT